MSKLTVQEFETLSDAELEDLDITEDELQELMDESVRRQAMGPMERLREDNQALKEAWEQIKTIQALTEKQQKEIDEKPSWERHYFEIVEGTVTDNEALKDAWERYYVLKGLIAPNKP